MFRLKLNPKGRISADLKITQNQIEPVKYGNVEPKLRKRKDLKVDKREGAKSSYSRSSNISRYSTVLGMRQQLNESKSSFDYYHPLTGFKDSSFRATPVKRITFKSGNYNYLTWLSVSEVTPLSKRNRNSIFDFLIVTFGNFFFCI